MAEDKKLTEAEKAKLAQKKAKKIMLKELKGREPKKETKGK